MRTVVVGTRQSALAVKQTNQVVEALRAVCLRAGIECEFQLKKIVTKGDRILDVTLSKVGGKGLFVKEIEQALLDGEIDLAVHSMKDMPAELPDGLVIGAVPPREDPRDCLISRGAAPLGELPQGARVGTSSLRRASQLKAARPDLAIETIRGNIDSRLRKLETEGFAAIVLAAAGLHRMGWQERISHYLPPDVCLPAVGQGALGLECRRGDVFVLELLARIDHEPTALAVAAERSFLAALQGGCQVPIGACASVSAERPAEGTEAGRPLITLAGMVGSPDGRELLKETRAGDDPARVGRELAEALFARGAERILAQARGDTV